MATTHISPPTPREIVLVCVFLVTLVYISAGVLSRNGHGPGIVLVDDLGRNDIDNALGGVGVVDIGGEKEYGKKRRPLKHYTGPKLNLPSSSTSTLRPTRIVAHVPGWSIIDSLYMYNSTWILVAPPGAREEEGWEGKIRLKDGDDPRNTNLQYATYSRFPKAFPAPKALLSNGQDVYGERGGMGDEWRRVPSREEIRYLTYDEAITQFDFDFESHTDDDERDTWKRQQGGKAAGSRDVPGLTFILNDPPQFITHYYHFCAELWFGVWRTYSSLLAGVHTASKGTQPSLPAPTRILFPHLDSFHWRDYASMNQLLLRTFLPSTVLQFSYDWTDYVSLSLIPSPKRVLASKHKTQRRKPRLVRFERVLLADRSAAMPAYNYQRFQRTAAVPFGLPSPGAGGVSEFASAISLSSNAGAGTDFWHPVRSAVTSFAGIDASLQPEVAGGTLGLVHPLPSPPERPKLEDLVGVQMGRGMRVWGPSRAGAEGKEDPNERIEEMKGYTGYEALVPLSRPELPETALSLSPSGGGEGKGGRTRPVITYLSRQSWNRRKLREEDHLRLVKELEGIANENGYTLIVVSPETLSRFEQIRLMARTTVLVGVHGNGLTGLLWMMPGGRSTVIEIFYPGGWAHDYEYTTRAMGSSLGMRHYGVWGDRLLTSPGFPPPSYPPGFQGNEIPVDGQVVANLIRERMGIVEAEDEG